MGEIGFDLIFPREYLRGALIVSLLSIWVLVQLSGAIVSQLIAQATQRSGRQT